MLNTETSTSHLVYPVLCSLYVSPALTWEAYDPTGAATPAARDSGSLVGATDSWFQENIRESQAVIVMDSIAPEVPISALTTFQALHFARQYCVVKFPAIMVVSKLSSARPGYFQSMKELPTFNRCFTM